MKKRSGRKKSEEYSNIPIEKKQIAVFKKAHLVRFSEKRPIATDTTQRIDELRRDFL